MKGIGLVLAGGGGKGAYQIGVWKYLHEYGLDQYIQAVSGTSVGSLNAALFASGDYQRAESLWLNVEPQQILSPRKISIKDVVSWGSQFLLRTSNLNPLSSAKGLLTPAANLLMSEVSTMLGRRYAFSRDGLIGLIREGINVSKIQNSPFPCYATCLSIPDLAVSRFDLRNYSAADMETILLASSAIPFVFDCVNFEGNLYYDGGIPIVGDNVPIQPVYETGVEYILVIHLSQDTPIDHSLFPNAKLIEIIPQVDLGGAVNGTLDFTASGAKWRIEQGYQDTQKIFGPFIQRAMLMKKSELLWQAYLKSEQAYRTRTQELEDKRRELMLQRDSDGFREMCDDLRIL